MITHIIFDFGYTLYDHDAKTLYPGVSLLLTRLKETYTLGLVSHNQNPEERKALIRALEIDQFFTSIIASPQKTEEEIKQALAQMGATAENTLVVDNRFDVGIVAANKLGCQTCWIRQGPHKDETPQSPEENPTYVIDRIDELARLIAS